MGRQEPQASCGDGSETCSAQGAKMGGSAVKQVLNTPRSRRGAQQSPQPPLKVLSQLGQGGKS